MRRTLASAKPKLRYGAAGDLAGAQRAKAGFKESRHARGAPLTSGGVIANIPPAYSSGQGDQPMGMEIEPVG